MIVFNSTTSAILTSGGEGSTIFIIHQNQRFLKQVFSKRLGLVTKGAF